MEGKSLFIFNVDNSLRRTTYNIVNHPYFDNCILALIILSTILAAIENPLLDHKSKLLKFLKITDIIIVVVFTLEMIMKILAFGLFFNGRDSYLKDTWNILDFTIVLISLSEFAFGEGVSVIKLLRTVRALRPLKLVTTN